MARTYDYIVVGGGSSACVVAARLLREKRSRVLILEAGPGNGHPFFKMPAAFVKLLDMPRYVTKYETTPQEQLDGRRHLIPQANVLGGGGNVNGMVYMRGNPQDFQDWEDATGSKRWGYENLLKSFRAQEGNQRLNGPTHNTDGPLKVSDVRHTCDMSRIYVRTVQSMGLPPNDDFNSGTQTGVGFMQLTTKGGYRVSAYGAFLRDLANDPNLTVETGARVNRVLFSNKRAVGVEYVKNGETRVAHADAEVIMAAGAFNTPKTLMLSGVGRADDLRRLGIDVKANLRGVGQNLQDHHEVPVIRKSKPGLGYFHEDRGLRMIANGLNWLLFKNGPVNSIGVDTCAFIDPFVENGQSNRPLIQLYCIPAIYVDHDVPSPADAPGVTLHACLMRPKSRGTVTLASADPAQAPLVNPNFLGNKYDLDVSVAGLRFARRVFDQAPMKDVVFEELLPGPSAISDEQLAAHCRRTVKTNHHPVGTCRMGRDDDENAVVTPDLFVKGVDGLRVVDASMFPNIVAGNTHAAVCAAADVAAGLIVGNGR